MWQLTGETQLPLLSLLHSLFFFCPHPHFFPLCTFCSSSICTAHSHLSPPCSCCFSKMHLKLSAHLPVLLVLLHLFIFSPFPVITPHWNHNSSILLITSSTPPFCLYVCFLFILYSTPSASPPPPLVTSSGAPSLPPTPVVLSQLGCGLDGSGPPLPSPRLQQQHQPQIQVIQQL